MKLAGLAMIGLTLFGCEAFRPAPKEAVRNVTPFGRVAVVEFFDHSRYTGTAEQFTAALKDQLADVTTGSDFIVIKRSALRGFEDPFTSGKLPVVSLAEARREYKADAVVIGTIDDHNPYPKPSIAISVKMIETAEATVVCEFSETWDANTARIERDIGVYYKENYGADDCRFGPDVFLISPRYFLKYAARRAAERILDEM
jgi:hypothetical protein